MPDARLHPELQRLLHGWENLTPAQEAAFGPITDGEHVLLLAPTGHGKTEAALLPVLTRLLHERDALAAQDRPWPPGFKVLYVTPLRALNRDLLDRLTTWSEALGLSIGVRHGDTSQSERAKQARKPPDVLITTPETVQLLLYGDKLRQHLATVRFVVVDEAHDLAASERGAQLTVALERIEEVILQPRALRETPARERDGPKVAGKAARKASAGGKEVAGEGPAAPAGFQRIGLSATVANPDDVARFLGGARPVRTVRIEGGKQWHLDVVLATPTDDDHVQAARLAIPPEAMAELRLVRGLVQTHRRVLVFQNTREGAETMVHRSAVLDQTGEGEGTLMALHHGSLSPEHREDVEHRFKTGRLHAVVATSSLELGIDVGEIDHVVQVHSPKSVARLLQRLGRAGHRLGAVSRGTLVADGPEDHVECEAIAAQAMQGRLEPLVVRDMPLVVLANQLVALTNEYRGVQRDWAFDVVRRAGVFLDLDEAVFSTVWDALLQQKALCGDAKHLERSGRARRQFLSHISLIPDEKRYRVFDEAGKRSVGTVDDAFVAAGLSPGSLFLMAGQSWRVLEIDADDARVRVAPVKDVGSAPQWSGSSLPVSAQVAGEVAALRPGSDSCAETVEAQRDAGLVVPDADTVCIEAGRQQITVHVALGTRGNEALGRITQALLHQRLGDPVAMESDAYRIHFQARIRGQDLVETWRMIDPDALDILLGLVLRDSPVVKHHLVYVAKQFGALPPDLDPNKTTKARLESLLADPALHEETLARLAHERFDLDAVAGFLRRLDEVRIVHQALGPMSRLGQHEARRRLAPRDDARLLREVRQRIEDSDVLMVCTRCATARTDVVRDLPRRIACRRCQSIDVACLRPWHEDQIPLLRRADTLSVDEAKQRKRLVKNGAMVAAFGSVACRCLVARGVGPDTTTRLLQKCADPEEPVFWRNLLTAELEFARTSAFWAD